MHSGASQHLSVIRGVDSGSWANNDLMDDHESICDLKKVTDMRVAVDMEENTSTHFHRGVIIPSIDAAITINNVNIYYSAHSSPPCSHS